MNYALHFLTTCRTYPDDAAIYIYTLPKTPMLLIFPHDNVIEWMCQLWNRLTTVEGKDQYKINTTASVFGVMHLSSSFFSFYKVCVSQIQIISVIKAVHWLTCHRVHKVTVNILTPRRNEQHFADGIFKRIFVNENIWISIKISFTDAHMRHSASMS